MKKVRNKFDSNIVLIRFELVIRDRVGPYIDEVMQGVIGTNSLLLRICIVVRHVLLPLSSHRWMLDLFYVTLVHRFTSDFITSNKISLLKKLNNVMYRF